jgi:hypothetical protein
MAQLATTAAGSEGDFAASGTGVPRHLALAEMLVKRVKKDRNAYANRNRFILWPGDDNVERAENHSDCSGLIALLLSRANGYTPRTFKDWTGQFFPTASQYFRLISDGVGFDRVKRLKDCLPGDLIAIVYPPEMKNTGHLMLIAERPMPAHPAPLAPTGLVAWDVRVIDSSRSNHGLRDTRGSGEDRARGIGKGTIRLCTDPAGRFAGYAWSTSPTSPYYDRSERPIVVGRFVRARVTSASVLPQ